MGRNLNLELTKQEYDRYRQILLDFKKDKKQNPDRFISTGARKNRKSSIKDRIRQQELNNKSSPLQMKENNSPNIYEGKFRKSIDEIKNMEDKYLSPKPSQKIHIKYDEEEMIPERDITTVKNANVKDNNPYISFDDLVTPKYPNIPSSRASYHTTARKSYSQKSQSASPNKYASPKRKQFSPNRFASPKRPDDMLKQSKRETMKKMQEKQELQQIQTQQFYTSPLKNHLNSIDTKIMCFEGFKTQLLEEIELLNLAKSQLFEGMENSETQQPFKRKQRTAKDKRLEFEKKWKLLAVHKKAIKNKYNLDFQMEKITNRYKKPAKSSEGMDMFATVDVFLKNSQRKLNLTEGNLNKTMPEIVFYSDKNVKQQNMINFFDDVSSRLNNLKAKRYQQSLRITNKKPLIIPKSAKTTYLTQPKEASNKNLLQTLSDDLKEIRQRRNFTTQQKLQKTIEKKYLSGGFERFVIKEEAEEQTQTPMKQQ